jgi:hypothetical protein
VILQGTRSAREKSSCSGPESAATATGGSSACVSVWGVWRMFGVHSQRYRLVLTDQRSHDHASTLTITPFHSWRAAEGVGGSPEDAKKGAGTCLRDSRGGLEAFADSARAESNPKRLGWAMPFSQSQAFQMRSNACADESRETVCSGEQENNMAAGGCIGLGFAPFYFSCISNFFLRGQRSLANGLAPRMRSSGNKGSRG